MSVSFRGSGLTLRAEQSHKSLNGQTGTPAVTPDEEMLEELRKIRELLTQKPPAPPPPAPKGFAAEFKAFLSEYKVLGLAVAFILGLYLGQLVQGLVNDMIMPVVSIATGSTGPAAPCTPGGPAVPAWQCLAAGPFLLGQFLGTVLTFIVVALVIFLIVKLTKRYKID
jgi:large conductance mechanosensitive channel